METYVLGIDFAFSPQKTMPMALIKITSTPYHDTTFESVALPIPPPQGPGKEVLIHKDKMEVFLNLFENYLSELQIQLNAPIECIAIDAPTTFCSENLKMRPSEKAIREEKVGIFLTPSQSSFQQRLSNYVTRQHKQKNTPVGFVLWMLPALFLTQQLNPKYAIYEAFPNWFWKQQMGTKYKSIHNLQEKKAELLQQYGIKNASEYVKNCSGPNNDKLDALYCGLLAAYIHQNKSIRYVGSEEDKIYVID
jgi:hypothetical protein